MITGVVPCTWLLLHAVKGGMEMYLRGTDMGLVLYKSLVDRGSKR